MPASLEDYNSVYENRAKAGLKEVNLFSDADIVCLQGLALSMQEIQNSLTCYNLISYANGCCILIKKYAKHFNPLYRTAFLHGTSVLLQAQDAIDIKLHVCSIDCHEKVEHEGCIVLREEKPTLYVGTGIYTHPVFTKMKLFGTVKSKEELQGVAFDQDETKNMPSDIIVKKGVNAAGKIPDKSIASTSPLFITVIWKGFHRVASENSAFTAFAPGNRIALKSEPIHDCDKVQVQALAEPVRLPQGIAIQEPTAPLSAVNKEMMLGKPIEMYAPSRLRRLHQQEFNVIFWNFGGAAATDFDKKQALTELTSGGADIVGLQGLQGITIDSLLPYYTLVKSNERSAILLNKRSSLMYSDAQEIVPLKGLSCTIYDVDNPQDEIMLYCLDLQDDATLYTYNLHVRPYNTIVMGTNLHENKISFSESLKDRSLYHVLGDKNNQIVATAFPHKIKLLAGTTTWQDATWQLYSGIGLITKYGRMTHTLSLMRPLFATFEWKGMVRYKMDVPHQKLPENRGNSH